MLWHTLRVLRSVAKGYCLKPPLASLATAHTTGVYVGARTMDLAFHVNNSRYLELAEFARWEAAARCGLLGKLLRTGALQVVSNVHVQYLKPMMCCQVIDVETRTVAVHWDARTKLVEHKLVQRRAGVPRGERVVFATIIVKLVFLHQGRPVALQTLGELFDDAALGEVPALAKPALADLPPPASGDAAGALLPDFVRHYNAADDAHRLSEKRPSRR
jgi:acyl-CoA thioesterase FadM